MVEVTDEIVKRAQLLSPFIVSSDLMRDFLNKVLNPPQEPEIVVTEEMLKTGVEVFRAPRHQPEPETSLAAAYRAMRRLEPPQGVSPERRKAQAKVLRMYERTDDSGALKYVARASRSTDAQK